MEILLYFFTICCVYSKEDLQSSRLYIVFAGNLTFKTLRHQRWRGREGQNPRSSAKMFNKFRKTAFLEGSICFCQCVKLFNG